jgi:prepilin-type N-terminal cleavage/methylation domain-containing protein
MSIPAGNKFAAKAGWMKLTRRRAGERQIRDRAFSLVEVLVAVVLASIFFTAVYTTLAFSFDWMRITREDLRATQILEQKTETIRLYNWDQVTNNGFISTNFVDAFYPLSNVVSGFSYTGSVAVSTVGLTEDYNNDLRLIDVQIQWKSGKVLRQRQMQTFVSRYGLQNYIY